MIISPELEETLMTVSITVLILFMGFIIYDLAKKSNAGKFGTIMLFVILGLGCLGFIMKAILVQLMDV